MQIEAVELRTVSLPLKSPFRTSFGTERVKDALLVRVVADDCEGWGECVAGAEPLYSSEYLAGAMDVMRSFLLPILFASGDLGQPTSAVCSHR